MTVEAVQQRESWPGYDRPLVGELSRQELARRAGVEPDYVDRLVELGILRPGTDDAFSPGDVRRGALGAKPGGPACRSTGWLPPSGTGPSRSPSWM